ncbi:MAG: glycoside hydrolase family 13 protein [Cyclobacteriaceae bacterium]
MLRPAHSTCMIIALTLLLSLSYLPGAIAQKSPAHLEPPFWWTGMAHDSLQLMVHGDNIAATAPELSYPGVTLAGTERTSNPNYLWLNLHLADNVQPGTFTILFKEGRKKRYRYEYELKAREEGSVSREGYGTEDVIYLITPDRYANGDTGNDVSEELGDELNRDTDLHRHGGDIQGIIDHLDYIEDMGFTAIWLNPVLENRQPKYSYHGYSTTDFYQVDPRFGTNELYRKLSDEASDRGIKLIKDVILNHIGSGHWWMTDLPDSNWLNFQKDYKITTHTREALQDPYASAYDKRMHGQGWFVPTMPDMNQTHPLMATYLIQNNIWWTEYAGLGGIRVDTYSYPDKAFLTEWTRRMMHEYPDFNIVGEEWSLEPEIVSYWQRDKQTFDGYTSYLPGVMDFPLQDAIIKGLQDDGRLYQVYQTLGMDRLYPHPEDLVIFADNHDMSRVFTQLDHDTAKLRQAMTLLLTMRGIPQVYYGTEVLMANPDSEDHGVIRSDFPGGWQDDEVSAFTGEGLPTGEKKGQEYMRKLLNWRKETPVIHSGELTHFAPEDKVYVYFRHSDTDKVMVVINKNTEEKELQLARFQEIIKGMGEAEDLMTGEGYDLNAASIPLPAGSALILQEKK